MAAARTAIARGNHAGLRRLHCFGLRRVGVVVEDKSEVRGDDETMQHAADIAAWQAADQANRPWMWNL
jgi:hypothetical protein